MFIPQYSFHPSNNLQESLTWLRIQGWWDQWEHLLFHPGTTPWAPAWTLPHWWGWRSPWLLPPESWILEREHKRSYISFTFSYIPLWLECAHLPSVMSARLVSTLPSMYLITARMTHVTPLMMDTLNRNPSWVRQKVQKGGRNMVTPQCWRPPCKITFWSTLLQLPKRETQDSSN